MDIRDIHAIAISLENWATGPSKRCQAGLHQVRVDGSGWDLLHLRSTARQGAKPGKNREVAPIFSSCGIMMNYGYFGFWILLSCQIDDDFHFHQHQQLIPWDSAPVPLVQAVITADSWEEMCDNAAEYFRWDHGQHRKQSLKLLNWSLENRKPLRRWKTLKNNELMNLRFLWKTPVIIGCHMLSPPVESRLRTPAVMGVAELQWLGSQWEGQWAGVLVSCKASLLHFPRMLTYVDLPSGKLT